MKNERNQLVFKLISTHLLVIPLISIISLFVKNDAFLIVSIAQSALVILFLAGYWEFFGLRFRYFYCAIMQLLVLLIVARKVIMWNETEAINWYLIAPLLVVQIYLIIEILKIFIVIFKPEKDGLEIVFPFLSGKYLVTDGGNSRLSRLMNYHFHSAMHKRKKTNNSMLFATDIIRLDKQSYSFMPEINEGYSIFGEVVVSPMSGTVVKVVNEIEDNLTYSGSYPYNTGNTIVIQKDDMYLLLGHLKKGSIKVFLGDTVKANDPLAQAGNSGYSERPHLHFQLIKSSNENYWNGTGISMEYKGINLYKNRVVIIESEHFKVSGLEFRVSG